MSLTIAYITARRESRSAWFFNSLAREVKATNYPWPRVIVVNAYHKTDYVGHGLGYLGEVVNIAPKPTPWQGEYRLTYQNWFAASNARNTALAITNTDWIAYVDDLSVLMPGWLSRIHKAMQENYIVCGRYQKVKKLEVANDGTVTNYEEFPAGKDNRRAHVPNDEPMSCNGNWLYGCSCAMPVESLLSINGWPEICDGLGFEDCCCGIVLENADYKFKYDPQMLTLESEEDHHKEPAFRREDWHFANGVLCKGGNGKDDKSHAALAIALQSKRFPNFCDFRELRESLRAGADWPAASPQHDWYTKQALTDL